MYGDERHDDVDEVNIWWEIVIRGRKDMWVFCCSFGGSISALWRRGGVFGWWPFTWAVIIGVMIVILLNLAL